MDGVRRRRVEGEEQRATTLELFYDLVFVFAITQVSHLLLDHLTPAGVGQAAIILLAVWWSWNYTTWVTNELDPDSNPVRLLLIGLMLASLVMAVAIPDAFEEHALLFAGSYVTIQVSRHVFLTFFSAERGTIERERAGHIMTWFVAAGVLWIAGALAGGAALVALWLAALAVDYSAPLVTYWIPGRTRLEGATWDVEPGHFAERFGLFVILTLGETIVLTGATTAELELSPARIVAFGLAFLATAALWWLYFASAMTLGQRHLELSGDRTLLARDAYTYLHVVLVAGVIVTAVGDELVIAHPMQALSGPEAAAVAAGPALYLLAYALFRYRLTGSPGRARLFGAGACLLIGLAGPLAPALVAAGLLVVVLVAVILAERATRSPAPGEPEAPRSPETAGG